MSNKPGQMRRTCRGPTFLWLLPAAPVLETTSRKSQLRLVDARKSNRPLMARHHGAADYGRLRPTTAAVEASPWQTPPAVTS